MTKDPAPKHVRTAKDDKAARRAAALKENLARRKAQKRARAADRDESRERG